MDSDREMVLNGAKKAFFEAMLAGYANATGEPVSGLVKTKSENGCEKTLTFTVGDYVVQDHYVVTPLSDYSAGTTTIFYKSFPVWLMAYGGYYPKDAIPFLKEALAKAYKMSQFLGGRGPEAYVETSVGLEYNNTFVSGDDSFLWFEGHEYIWSKGVGKALGTHKYFGMSLI
jgi:hypothetical protein